MVIDEKAWGIIRIIEVFVYRCERLKYFFELEEGFLEEFFLVGIKGDVEVKFLSLEKNLSMVEIDEVPEFSWGIKGRSPAR